MDDWYDIVAWVVGAILFFGIWIYCSMTYGFLGFALGWMPAAIISGIAALLWPLLVLVALGIGFWILKNAQ